MKKSDKIERKFIESYDVNDYEILTDDGWKDIDSIHKTIKYDSWTIKTTHYKLTGADNHIVFREDYSEVFICELKIGDRIITERGVEDVIEVTNNHIMENMYDVSVHSNEHRFYSNGILSHNSTSYSIYCLWYAITNENKSILICANKFKTAKDILSRIKLAYTKLPQWMKPGIVEWNASSIKFENGCKISAEATSGSSGRGGSINCLAGEETIQILIDDNVYIIPLKRAYDMFKLDIIKNDENTTFLNINS